MFTQQTTTVKDHFETTALPVMNDLFRVACRTLKNQTEAEEVVQEVYLQAWKSFHRYEPGTNCRAWLFKIMFHVIDHHRRKSNRLVTLNEDEQYIFDDLAWEPPVSQELSDQEMISALDRVPENYRVIIMMADVYEYAYREISQILRIPQGTVMSRLSRGRNILRTELMGRQCWA
jgi:RNA polymerase sigma-70 factor (ECF subfamily)